MTTAGRGLQTMQVTEAVRDATVTGHKVRKGQTIVLDPDDGLLAVDKDPAQGGPGRPRAAGARVLADHPVLRRGLVARRRGGARPAHPGGGARPGGRGHGPRRAAPLPVPDLRGVTERRRSGPARGSRSLRPAVAVAVAREPEAILAAPVGLSGLAGVSGLRRQARRLGVDTVRDLAVPPAAAVRRPARAPPAARPARPRRRDRGLRAGPGRERRGPADLPPPGPGDHGAPRGRHRVRDGDLVRAAVRGAADRTRLRDPGLGQDQASPGRAWCSRRPTSSRPMRRTCSMSAGSCPSTG